MRLRLSRPLFRETWAAGDPPVRARRGPALTRPPLRPAPAQVPVTELESWVVRAISAGLIDARMDQQARSLTVLRSLQRDVNVTQWTELQRKLHAWRDAVGTSTATLAAAR